MSNPTRPLAFVTGGSSGIGDELAEQLAQHGYDMAISGSSDRVHNSAGRLRDLGAPGLEPPSRREQLRSRRIVRRFIERLGRPVEVAVLNVGIATGGAFAEVLAVNVTRTTHMAKRVVDDMVANGIGQSPDRLIRLGHHTHALRGRLRRHQGLRVLAR